MARRGDTATGDEVYKEALRKEVRSHYFSPNYAPAMAWDDPTRKWQTYHASHFGESLGNTWSYLGVNTGRSGQGPGALRSPTSPTNPTNSGASQPNGSSRAPSVRSGASGSRRSGNGNTNTPRGVAEAMFSLPRGHLLDSTSGANGAGPSPRCVPAFAQEGYRTCPGFAKPRNMLGPDCAQGFASFQRVMQCDVVAQPRWRSLAKQGGPRAG